MVKLKCDMTDGVQKSITKLQPGLTQFTSNVTSLYSKWVNEFHPLWVKVIKICLHLHAKHYHNVGSNLAHDFTDLSTTTKACVLANNVGNIDTLSSSQNGFADLLQTGLIFGRDFAFTNTSTLPRYFKSMFDPDVNEFHEEIMNSLYDYNAFIKNAFDELFKFGKCNPIIVNDNDNDNIYKALIIEYFLEQDLDNNGLIYGIDFIIDDDNNVDEIKDINITNNLNSCVDTKLSIHEFIDTITPDEIMKCNILPFTKKELIDELKTEFLTNTDVNNDGLIYGRDFYIIGSDKPEELNSILPLYLPNIITSWTAYVKSREFNSLSNIDKYVNILIAEAEQLQDLDGNELVYGVDFHVGDEFGSALLTSSIGPLMTCDQYMSTISPYVEDYVFEENIQAAKLNAEWIDKQDVDGNGLIYGPDILITDYDENKTECLWTIERYRGYSLSWTQDKLDKLNLVSMISNYSITEFNQYWGLPQPTPDVIESYDWQCNQTQTHLPIIPLQIHSIDITNHIILYNGKYWFDLGVGDTISYSGIYRIPNGELIDLTGLQIIDEFEQFTDSSILYFDSQTQYTNSNPYVFKTFNDKRLRVYNTLTSFSIVDSCIILNDATVEIIEFLQSSNTYFVISDERINKSIPIDFQNLTGYFIKWIYDSITHSGTWVKSYFYQDLLNNVMITQTENNLNRSITVPMHKQSDQFKHFVPYVWNITWNDL
jgi:hypothetical protein